MCNVNHKTTAEALNQADNRGEQWGCLGPCGVEAHSHTDGDYQLGIL